MLLDLQLQQLPRGPSSMFSNVDGGRSRIFSSSTSQEARYRCFLTLVVSALGSLAPAPPRGGRHQCFLMLMVGAPGSPAPAPLRGPPSMFLSVGGGRYWIFKLRHLPRGPLSTFSNVDGGHSRIFSSGTSQGVRRRRFLILMVHAPESSAPVAPRGPVVDVS
jgi:hypothetical protein